MSRSLGMKLAGGIHLSNLHAALSISRVPFSLVPHPLVPQLFLLHRFPTSPPPTYYQLGWSIKYSHEL